MQYKINLDGEDDIGIPGLAFQQKRNVYTQDVWFYSAKEYSQCDFARTCNISSCFACPVFETSSQDCIGVLEFATTSSFAALKSTYNTFLKHSLKAVGLKSSTCNCTKPTIPGAEIYQGLEVVCETHKIPLALAWVPCSLGCSSSYIEQSFHIEEPTCYIIDTNLLEFMDFCGLIELRKGQGVAGRAYLSQKPCFCEDITQFSISECPLLPDARLFGLKGCFAVYLQSKCAENPDHILEFFLNPENNYGEDPISFLGPILETLSEHFTSFKLASGELGDENAIAIIKPSEPVALEIVNSGGNLVSNASPNSVMREELMKLSGKGMKEAAAIMKVSISTLRRRCRKCGIQRWGSDPVIAPQPHTGNPVATPSRIIIATCGDDTIRFTLPLSSGIVELKEKVSMRLENLIGGSYKIKFKDHLGRCILMACDEDVQDCLNGVANVSNPFDLKAEISMVIEPVI